MTLTIFEGLDALRAAVGAQLGPSGWSELTAERVEKFAQATGDADPTHHALVLAMSNELLPQVIEVRGISMGVNYGVDGVRFPAPVSVGARVRARAEIVEVTEVRGGVQAAVTITMEAEGIAEPACEIESLSRYFA